MHISSSPSATTPLAVSTTYSWGPVIVLTLPAIASWVLTFSSNSRLLMVFRFSVLRWSPPYQDYIFSAPPLLGAMVPSCTSFLERNTRQMLSSAMSQYPHESPREYLSIHGCLAYQHHA